jgi:hypothetical protein
LEKILSASWRMDFFKTRRAWLWRSVRGGTVRAILPLLWSFCIKIWKGRWLTSRECALQ